MGSALDRCRQAGASVGITWRPVYSVALIFPLPLSRDEPALQGVASILTWVAVLWTRTLYGLYTQTGLQKRVLQYNIGHY